MDTELKKVNNSEDLFLKSIDKIAIQPTRNISKLRPYTDIKQPWWQDSTPSDYLNLSWNESVIPTSEYIKNKILTFINSGNFNYYPDVNCKHLKEKLEIYTGVNEQNILVFSGSDSALEYISRTYIENGDNVVFAGPTYDNMRVYIESCGGTVLNCIHKNPLIHDKDTVLNSISKNTKMVYLVSPNNPTGFIWSKSDVLELSQSYPNTLFIIDEAYFEFSNSTCAKLVENNSNIIVCRTFSKAFGLAGLRCGYIMAHEDIIREINKIRVGKNVSTIAQIAAIAALEDIEFMKEYVKKTKEGQNWLCNQLKDLGFWTYNTNANFILVKVKEPIKTCEMLSKHNIFIRNRSNISELENMVRITTGPKEYMKKLIEVWNKVAEAI